MSGFTFAPLVTATRETLPAGPPDAGVNAHCPVLDLPSNATPLAPVLRTTAAA